MDDSQVGSFAFTDDSVLEVFNHLKPKKSDGSELDSNNYILAFPVIFDFLTNLCCLPWSSAFKPERLIVCLFLYLNLLKIIQKWKGTEQ